MQKKLYLNLKYSYEFTCPHCDKTMQARPSLMMETFQMNVGGGSCLFCKKMVTLVIADDNLSMTALAFYPKEIEGLPDACYSAKEPIPEMPV